MHFAFQGRDIATDARGYLLERGDWTPALAEAMAAADGITLTPAHWEVIDFLRAYHDEYAMAPPMRLLVKAYAAAHGAAKADSRQLYRLFPEGSAKQACRYAGLPRQVSCI